MENAAHETVSKGYDLIMDEDEATTHDWPERPGCYVRIKRPSPKGDDRITSAAAGIVMGEGKTGRMEFGPNAAFVQKCIEQIEDFVFPVSNKGERATIKFDRHNEGRNRDLYWKLADPGRSDMRQWLEELLDLKAGRDVETQRDLADLGEGPGS